MWVLTPRMERALSSFQHRVAQWITGRQPRRRGVGVGDTPHWMKNGGSRLEVIGKYVTSRQNTVAKYIAKRPILDIYEQTAQRPGERVYWRWSE